MRRIEYIDALRGFTMLLVVIGHIALFSFGVSPFGVDVTHAFRMPLFFFISGFIAYTSNRICDGKSYCRAILKKCKVQIIPTLIFGLFFTYVVLGYNAEDFFHSESKLGYWFTIALLQMFIVYYTIHILFRKSQRALLIALTITAISMWVLKKIFEGNEVFVVLNNSISLWLAMMYFPFFVFGVIAAMHKEKFHRLLDSKYFIALTILSFIALYILKNNATPFTSVINIIIGFPGLIIVYAFFRRYSETFSQENVLGRSLQYIGRRTLDIYLLHYFFLPDLKIYSHFVETTNTVVGIFICFVIAVMVISMCLLVSSILRMSPIMSEYMFGVKQK